MRQQEGRRLIVMLMAVSTLCVQASAGGASRELEQSDVIENGSARLGNGPVIRA